MGTLIAVVEIVLGIVIGNFYWRLYTKLYLRIEFGSIVEVLGNRLIEYVFALFMGIGTAYMLLKWLKSIVGYIFALVLKVLCGAIFVAFGIGILLLIIFTIFAIVHCKTPSEALAPDASKSGIWNWLAKCTLGIRANKFMAVVIYGGAILISATILYYAVHDHLAAAQNHPAMAQSSASAQESIAEAAS